MFALENRAAPGKRHTSSTRIHNLNSLTKKKRGEGAIFILVPPGPPYGTAGFPTRRWGCARPSGQQHTTHITHTIRKPTSSYLMWCNSENGLELCRTMSYQVLYTTLRSRCQYHYYYHLPLPLLSPPNISNTIGKIGINIDINMSTSEYHYPLSLPQSPSISVLLATCQPILVST